MSKKPSELTIANLTAAGSAAAALARLKHDTHDWRHLISGLHLTDREAALEVVNEFVAELPSRGKFSVPKSMSKSKLGRKKKAVA
jgi:hypothetical protein